MKKIIWILVAVVVMAGLVWLGVFKKQPVVKGEIIKVGAPLALTGTAAVDAMNIQRGLELAKEDLAKSGVNVKIIYEDDGTDSKKTVSAVNKLISVDKVDFLVGPTWSFLTDAGSPIYNNAGIVSFNPANTSEFTNGGKNTFYGATKNEFKKAPFVKWLKENKKTRVAAIVDKAPWGESNLLAIKAAAEEVGAQVVFVEEVPMGQESSIIPTSLIKMIAAKPDVLITTGYEQTFAVIAKKSHELKINIPIIFSTAIVGGLIKNGVVTMMPGDEFYETTSVINDSFKTKFFEKYKEVPGLYADRAYDGLMLLVEAFKNKKADQSMENYLRNDTNYKGYGAIYNFDDKGDIVADDWVVMKLDNK